MRIKELETVFPSLSDDRHPKFLYPIKFLPVQFHQDLSYVSLLNTVIPLCRQGRQVEVHVPKPPDQDTMDVDQDGGLQRASVKIRSDGILFYVSEASYEAGSSPLSVWVPLRDSKAVSGNSIEKFER